MGYYESRMVVSKEFFNYSIDENEDTKDEQGLHLDESDLMQEADSK